MTAALILAHAGHWFSGLLYLAPVVIVVGALGSRASRTGAAAMRTPRSTRLRTRT